MRKDLWHQILKRIVLVGAGASLLLVTFFMLHDGKDKESIRKTESKPEYSLYQKNNINPLHRKMNHNMKDRMSDPMIKSIKASYQDSKYSAIGEKSFGDNQFQRINQIDQPPFQDPQKPADRIEGPVLESADRLKQWTNQHIKHSISKAKLGNDVATESESSPHVVQNTQEINQQYPIDTPPIVNPGNINGPIGVSKNDIGAAPLGKTKEVERDQRYYSRNSQQEDRKHPAVQKNEYVAGYNPEVPEEQIELPDDFGKKKNVKGPKHLLDPSRGNLLGNNKQNTEKAPVKYKTYEFGAKNKGNQQLNHFQTLARDSGLQKNKFSPNYLDSSTAGERIKEVIKQQVEKELFSKKKQLKTISEINRLQLNELSQASQQESFRVKNNPLVKQVHENAPKERTNFRNSQYIGDQGIDVVSNNVPKERTNFKNSQYVVDQGIEVVSNNIPKERTNFRNSQYVVDQGIDVVSKNIKYVVADDGQKNLHVKDNNLRNNPPSNTLPKSNNNLQTKLTNNDVGINIIKHCILHDFNTEFPFAESISCKKVSRYQPPTIFCLYPAFSDIEVSRTLSGNEIWEPKIQTQIIEHLAREPTMGFIDIGANIGAHSIHLAKLGRQVVAVEPIFENIKRFHKAVVLNKITDRVTLLRHAVYNEYTEMEFEQPPGKGNDKGSYYGIATRNGDVSTILLDDLLEVIPFKTAVMKIDIEGLEPKAFLHASKLLSNIHIDAIFMDWSNIKPVFLNSNSVDYKLVTDMIQLLNVRSYVPLKMDVGDVAYDMLDLTDWGNWPDDVKFVLREHI